MTGMRIIIVSIMLVLNLNQGCTKNILKEVSLAISEEQLKEDLRKKGEDYYHTIRTKLIELDSLDIFQNSDTLFFLETYEYETGTFYGKIWSTKAKINYTYKQRTFNFGESGVFSDFTCELLEKWDIKTIREEEIQNSTMTSPFFIYGTRAMIKDEAIKVDCIGFKEFFSLEKN